jgi:hypothetical protein
MKITIEQYDEKRSVENQYDDLDIWEVASLLKAVLVLIGHHPETVEKIFKEEE